MNTSNEKPLLTVLSEHERRVWDALVSGDMDADAKLLDDHFLGVYSDGFAGKSDHTSQLADGPTINSYSLESLQARALGPEHALISYRATFQRGDRTTPEVMYVSSIWKRQGPSWINIFSQDTPEISG